MRENKIEAYLVRRVKAVGGECIKQYNKDDPDRLCLFPLGRMCFAETKMTGEKPRPGQARRHARLWKLGFPVMIIDSKELVDAFVERFSK